MSNEIITPRRLPTYPTAFSAPLSFMKPILKTVNAMGSTSWFEPLSVTVRAVACDKIVGGSDAVPQLHQVLLLVV